MNESYYVPGFTLRRRLAPTDTDKGVFTEITRFRGYIQPISGSVVFQQGKETYKATHRLFCSVSLQAQAGDFVDYINRTYRVRRVNVDGMGVSGMQIHQELDVELIE